MIPFFPLDRHPFREMERFNFLLFTIGMFSPLLSLEPQGLAQETSPDDPVCSTFPDFDVGT